MGWQLYGNAIIVNTDFAEANPDVIKGFLGAVAAGWKDAIADPAKAIESLIERNPAADAALETRRLQLAIDANVATEAAMANGIGGSMPHGWKRRLRNWARTTSSRMRPMPRSISPTPICPMRVCGC